MAHDIPAVTDEQISLIRNCARSVTRDGPIVLEKLDGANLLRLASGSQLEWLQNGPEWAELLLEEIARLRRRSASHETVQRDLEARNTDLSNRLQATAAAVAQANVFRSVEQSPDRD